MKPILRHPNMPATMIEQTSNPSTLQTAGDQVFTVTFLINKLSLLVNTQQQTDGRHNFPKFIIK
jgi:hypothetical protein